MDREVLEKLEADVEELCRQHRQSLQRCLRNFTAAYEGAPKPPPRPDPALPLLLPPRLEPLKPHGWTHGHGRNGAAAAAAEGEHSMSDGPRSSTFKGLARDGSLPVEESTPAARWLSGQASASFWLDPGPGSQDQEGTMQPASTCADTALTEVAAEGAPVESVEAAEAPALPDDAEAAEQAAPPQAEPERTKEERGERREAREERGEEERAEEGREGRREGRGNRVDLETTDFEEDVAVTEQTEATVKDIEPPALEHVGRLGLRETATPRELHDQKGRADPAAASLLPHVPPDSMEDPAASRRTQVPRLYKMASSHGMALRAAMSENAEEEEDEAEQARFSGDVTDFHSQRKTRGSMSSNFSDAQRRASILSARSASPLEEVAEYGDAAETEVRHGRRAKVELKSLLKALPPSVLQQAEDNGISQKHLRKSAFLASESRRRVTENQTLPQRIVSSSTYESLSGTFILLNCAFVAWQTQSKALEDELRAENFQELTMAEPVLFNVIQGAFTLIFSVDLFARICADKSFFCHYRNKEFLWNLLDSLVVAFDLVSVFLEVWVQFGLLRMMRVLRIVRVVKIIRVMKSFSELRMLMYSIISCIKSLVWVIAVLALMLGLFAVLFTSATGSELDTAEKRRDPRYALLVKTFGTLDRSVIELYLAMTGGTDWIVQLEAVYHLPVIYHGLFLIYITFGIYALANVITSIFLENARKSSKSDREHVIQEELQGKAQYLRDIEMIFAEMDADGNGLISREEFHETLKDERVVAYFRSMKLDAREAEHLYNLLDYDGSGEVSYPEFVDGCWKLQGEARSLDVKIMQLEVTGLSKAIRSIQDAISKIDGKALDLE